jgi:hypothetical protein
LGSRWQVHGFAFPWGHAYITHCIRGNGAKFIDEDLEGGRGTCVIKEQGSRRITFASRFFGTGDQQKEHYE